eukprot:TRINITY_DN178_c0_g1_i1.p1 TRINITY_DN178_c0_g1~~TRINITY_DN178_c0_g1_i1.p1  ORF type:complete len:154 (+),score=23.47 TRINITY_DN178_c0_g1_i1:172-633(+)
MMWAQRLGDWESQLTACELALNSRPLDSSHLTPFYLTFGFHPVTPSDIHALAPKQPTTELPKDFGARLHLDMEVFAARINQANLPDVIEPSKAPFAAGDWVLVAAARPALLTKEERIKPAKLRPKWAGPFRIVRIGSGDTAELRLPQGANCTQ